MSLLDDSAFCKLWKSLYDPATVLASRTVEQEELIAMHREHVVAILSGMTKIVFGVDENKKAVVVSYGMGGLELTLQLLHSCKLITGSRGEVLVEESQTTEQQQQQQQQEDVWRSGLKMMKCLVVKSKVGRRRCREAAVLSFLGSALETFLHEGNASMMDEALTTLAAILLGDDLNALQAAVQLRHYVDRASLRFPNHETMHQKIHYLTTLFHVMEQEHAALLDKIQDDFFDKVALVELELRMGMEAQRQEEYDESQQHYTRGLDELQSMPNDTGLLDSLWCQLLEKRACVKLELCDWDGALRDVHAILEFNQHASSAHVLKARALEGMGNVNEAKETLCKAIVANPQDEALVSQMERLNVK